MEAEIRFPSRLRVFLTTTEDYFVLGERVVEVQGPQVTLEDGTVHRIRRSMIPHAAYWAAQYALKRARGPSL